MYSLSHCSATSEGQHITTETIREWHTSPPWNWSDIGYHFIILNDGMGTVERGRPVWRNGAHPLTHTTTHWGVRCRCNWRGVFGFRIHSPPRGDCFSPLLVYASSMPGRWVNVRPHFSRTLNDGHAFELNSLWP